MKIEQIYTRRSNKGQNYAQPIIYEWEDIISKVLNTPIFKYPLISKFTNHFDIHSSAFGPYRDTFRFVINGRDKDEPMNSKHIIPCVIDFFERENQLHDFYNRHSKNKIILVSSPFDRQYLVNHNCPIRVELFPYSISDKYAITDAPIEKKYDIVLTGRQDPLLYSFFKEYIKKNPDVTYVKRGQNLEYDDRKTRDYYINGKECLGSIGTREEFMKLQSLGKVTLYSVQGYDEGYTNGFFHMTPHFLEIIASYSHVIARYPSGEDGIDARYYEFDKFSPSVENYEEFEAAMNHALSTSVDKDMYSSYLMNHYTSYRVVQLKNMLLNI